MLRIRDCRKSGEVDVELRHGGIGSLELLPRDEPREIGIGHEAIEQGTGRGRQIVCIEGKTAMQRLQPLVGNQIEQAELVAEVQIDQALVGASLDGDPIDACAGEPVPGELTMRGVEQPIPGGR